MKKEIEVKFEFIALKDELLERIKKEVWKNGILLSGVNPDVYRCDIYGDTIKYESYNNSEEIYSWKIAYKDPSNEDDKTITNLHPVHIKNF